MANELQRAEKVLQRINELAAVSEAPDCIARTYGTASFLEGRRLVENWMKEAGLETRIDAIGNIRGRLSSKKSTAKTLVIASHIDTVINAGRFDGPLGVLAGLDLLEQVVIAKTELPFHIELVAFCDEEGCRFHTTYLGSKVLAGSFDNTVLNARDSAGISLKEAIQTAGGNENNLSKDAIAQEEWLGYFEIHIEQGPVLYERNIPVGVVNAIAGQRRVNIVFRGEAGHAGTVPMNMRKDALACAAAFILETERFAKTYKDKLVATVGKLQITHAASNVIPGEVMISLDLRSADEHTLSAAYDELKKMAETICRQRDILSEWNLVQQAKPVLCDPKMKTWLHAAIQQSGYEEVEIVSGAGHDAVPVSEVSPVAMLFVRCFKGISHNPQEDVELKDLAAAIKVSEQFLNMLIANY